MFSPDDLKKETEKKNSSKFKRLLNKVARTLRNWRSEYLFADSLSMLNYVIQNNPYILECVKISLVQFLAEDPQPLKAVLDFLDGLYAGIFAKVAC